MVVTAADWPLPATTVMLEEVPGPMTKELLRMIRVPSLAWRA